MKKRFRVRVKHFARTQYVVQWSYSRWIPIWHSLNFWFTASYGSGMECWSIKLYEITEAERVAASLKGVADIDAYYEPERRKRDEFLTAEAAYLSKKVPYQMREIKS